MPCFQQPIFGLRLLTIAISHRAGRGKNICVVSEICPWGRLRSRGPDPLRPARLFEMRAELLARPPPSVALRLERELRTASTYLQGNSRVDEHSSNCGAGSSQAARAILSRSFRNSVMPSRLRSYCRRSASLRVAILPKTQTLSCFR